MADEGFCEREDVRHVLQESTTKFGTAPLSTDMVTAAIVGASDWLRRRSRHWWYDSTGSAGDLVPTSARTASAVRLDVPSSPHRQDRQLFNDHQGARYPVTTHGPFARIRLPHYDVQSLTTLEVRDRGGGVTDWVADPDVQSGRDEDYYLEADGASEYGATYLYVRASSIGSRVDYGGLLTLEYDYGLDADTDDWQSVRRGVAAAAAAELVSDDDVLTAIPDGGQLIGVDTQVQQLVTIANKRLGPYLDLPVQ